MKDVNSILKILKFLYDSYSMTHSIKVWKFPNSVDIWVVYWAWDVHNVAADNPVINPAGTNVHFLSDETALKKFNYTRWYTLK